MKTPHPLSHDRIRINFSNDDDTSNYSIDYCLYDHSVASRWLGLMKETLRFGNDIVDNGIYFGSAVNDKKQLIKKLNNIVETHNRYCDQRSHPECKIPVKADDSVTQDLLNILHGYFEIYAEDPRFSDEPGSKYNLQDMNLYIHRLESCIKDATRDSHVEILPKNVLRLQFEHEDYKLFSPDTIWGQLVLTYGITGVPTINAFWNNSEPTPQNSLMNGMLLAFWSDVQFDRHEELKKWLETKGLDINNPEIALGYLPLGLMVGIENCDKDEVLRQISLHPKVVSYNIYSTAPRKEVTYIESKAMRDDVFEDTGRSAQWPFDLEVFYHLDLVPYIDLNVQFDAQKLFDEAYKARDYFVIHRDYDQKSGESFGKWKSLGLRSLHGDYSKTQYHTSYVFDGAANYQNTAFAELCPETMKFLNTLTDLSQCERVRFMLLEPGASINVHRDSKERDVSLAVNISLNMPTGCEFYAQLNPDGTENSYSVKLPFKNSGSVLLFNNAKYHRVVNNSNTPRIHIIFHGPIRFTDEEILKLARIQNNISNRKDLLKKLIQKKTAMGEEFTKTPSLLPDWMSSGLAHDSLPQNYALAVYDHNQYHDGNSEIFLKRRTAPTLFPLSYTVIKENEWDAFIKKSYSDGREFAVIFAAGSFVLDISNFIQGMINDCQQLKNKGWPAAGHIMDFKNKNTLPYFHEQFILINLKAWHELGEIPLGPLFGTESGDLHDAVVSEEQVHDDYTPLYIHGSEKEVGQIVRSGLYSWGSALIMAAVNAGKGVLNISSGIRNSKMYAYPRDDMDDGRKKIEQVIADKMEISKGEVYCFNNENLEILKVPNLVPTKMISVAAGFKPFQIIKQYNYPENAKFHFVDFSPNALNYVKALTEQTNLAGLRSIIENQIRMGTTTKLKDGVADSLLRSTVRDFFDDQEEKLMDAISMARSAKFQEVNLIQHPEQMVDLLSEGEQFIIWVSNAFYNNQLYFYLTPEEANASLERLATMIGNKTSLRVYRMKNSYTFVFGKGLDFIKGMLTDGCVQVSQFTKEYWDEIRP